MTPFTLTPSSPYTLSYYITDHTDPTAYFVQAVVYDAATGAVLDTQNLVQQATNSHWYSKVAQAPGDPSGHGRRILVVATAYQDSGYTIKSPLYQQQPENYIVVAPGAGLSLGGGGGQIDYRMIESIFVQQLGGFLNEFRLIFPILQALQDSILKIPTDMVNLSPLLIIVQSLAEQVANLPTEVPPSVDLSPLHEAIGAVVSAVQAKEVTPAADMSPILDAIQHVSDAVASFHGKMNLDLTSHMADLHEILPNMIAQKTTEGINGATFSMPALKIEKKAAETPQEAPDIRKPVDISKLIG